MHCLFFNSAGYLFAGTGIGLCRSVEPIITSVDDSFSEAPQSFLLFQNYPNPFNPSTIIRYAVAERSNVVINIYNIAGEEIATLVNEEKPAGSYEIIFDAHSHSGNVRNLGSGVYFCRFSVVPKAQRDLVLKDGQTDNYSKTIKMLYLK
ncbi:MAG: T9SS type A sorting domain-containing protein [Ignavibacteriaceae bacterium]|nr:T9SS type A sorting domain-containing protein [Ignavibacteriaceae bacterium]